MTIRFLSSFFVLALLFGCTSYETRSITADAAGAYLKARLQRHYDRGFIAVADAVHHLNLATNYRSISPEEGRKILVQHLFDITGDEAFADRFGTLIFQLSESRSISKEEPKELEKAISFRKTSELRNEHFAFFIEKLDFQLQQELK